jgi:hypothetical protein
MSTPEPPAKCIGFDIDKYSLCNAHARARPPATRTCTQRAYPRNWNLEGSTDGAEWVVLRTHINAQVFDRAKTASWDVDAKANAFTHFRIHQTGVNRNGNNRLNFSGFEIYGTCARFIPGTVRSCKRAATPTESACPPGVVHWLISTVGTMHWLISVARR